MRFLLITLFLSNILPAQNLVINPGFEECEIDSSRAYVTNIISNQDIALPGWTMPTGGTSDHFYIKDTVTSRANRGSLKPDEGHCYAGFITSDGYYEYLTGSFSEPLQKGKTYTVSFALGTQFNSDFTEKRIGIHFASSVKQVKGFELLKLSPQITLDTIADRKIRGDWLIYTTTYKARGGETVFTIGEFCDFRDCALLEQEAEYFYIDNVFIGTPGEEEVVDEPVDTIVTITPPVLSVDTAAIAPGKTLVANNIYFETGKSRILPESYTPLYDIILEMKLQPNLKVEIVGHTDSHGDKASNQKLSEERAKAVADFFIAKGIDPARITTRGAGSSQPVGDDDQKNRRVEFIFSE